MSITIAVCGSTKEVDGVSFELAQQVGAALKRAGHQLITGACPGYPLKAVEGYGPEAVGIALWSTQERQVAEGYPVEGMEIEYPGVRMGRNALIIERADAAVFFPGKVGTLNELTTALACERPIFAAGAFADRLTETLKAIGASVNLQRFDSAEELMELLANVPTASEIDW